MQHVDAIAFDTPNGTSILRRNPTTNAFELSNDGGITFGPVGGGGGFGSDTVVQLPNSGAALINAWESLITLATNTAGSEAAQYVLRLVQTGALVDAFGLGWQNGVQPTLYLGPVANNVGLRANVSTNHLQFNIGGVAIDLGSTGMLLSTRLQEGRANGSIATNTLTLAAAANLTTVPGTPTINGIATANIQAGYSGRLELASGSTVVHNSGAPGGGAVAILTPTAANIVTASARVLPISYNGTNFFVDG